MGDDRGALIELAGWLRDRQGRETDALMLRLRGVEGNRGRAVDERLPQPGRESERPVAGDEQVRGNELQRSLRSF